jgi:hypothetical protein
VSGGDVVLMDDTQVKDRFLRMAATARALLGDFREVEQNFRALDRAVRERIALWGGARGQLLQQMKIHIIEPYVAGVGFVHNEDGSLSVLRNLTIEEYRLDRPPLPSSRCLVFWKGRFQYTRYVAASGLGADEGSGPDFPGRTGARSTHPSDLCSGCSAGLRWL